MSQIALQILVGTALTDSRFREKLLNGKRPTLLAEFDLTDEERETVLSIEACSIQEFAARLGDWLETQESVTGPAWVQGETPMILTFSSGVQA